MFFFSSRRRHTRWPRDWSSDVCSSDLASFPVALTSEGGELPLDLDMKRMLHGEQEFIYERVIHAGDKLHCQMSVADLYEKEGKSGTMQFLVLDTEMKDENNKLVVTSRMNIIYRPAIS